MIIDAREIDQDAEIETDLCIVGAGAAGIAIARTLESSGIQVCLLESGGLAYKAEYNDLYRGEDVGLPYWPLHECQMRAFGGNTNCWGGWCRPFDEIELAHRPWVPHSGWPITRGELEPYYKMAHTICQISSARYDADEIVAELQHELAKTLPVDPQQLETAIYRFSPPTRFRFAYFDDINRSQNIRCFIYANVTNIHTDRDGRTVERLTVRCLDGAHFTVRASAFVLAAGGTENPRLLLNSRDFMACGLGNYHDLVGRYFMEHPHTKRYIRTRMFPAPLSLYGLHYHPSFSARLSLTPDMQEQEQLLGYTANIHPVFVGGEGPGWLALRKVVLSFSHARRGDPFLRFPPYGQKNVTANDIWQIVRTLPQTFIGGVRSLTGHFWPEMFLKGYVLESKSEQAPNRDSRVILQHERDVFGLNRIHLDWRTLPLDRYTVVRAEQIVENELDRLNIGTLEPLRDEEVVGWPKSGLEGGWHQLGTTRMNDDPRKGVVDRHGRVHGISNLYVAGGSVFPTGGSGPPTLTIVAMALRLANHLRNRFCLAADHSVEPVRERV